MSDSRGKVRRRPGAIEARRSGVAGDQRGQVTTEYALILVIMSVPISLAMLKFLQYVIRVVVTAIVGDFTEGHI